MSLRERVWIDKHVQGVLIGRTLLYWFCGLVYLGLGTACFQYYQHPDWSLTQHTTTLFTQFGPWLPTLILVMPLVVFDVVRLSSLFAGPIYRLRLHLEELKLNPDCEPLTFRSDDYWRNLIAPVNALQMEIQDLHFQLNELRHREHLLQRSAEPILPDPEETGLPQPTAPILPNPDRDELPDPVVDSEVQDVEAPDEDLADQDLAAPEMGTESPAPSPAMAPLDPPLPEIPVDPPAPAS